MTHYLPGKLQVVTDLAEAKYFSVPDGAKAIVAVNAFAEMHLDGICKVIARTPVMGQAGSVYPMKISVGDVNAKILPGMKTNVHVDVPALEKVLLVPTTAVFDSAVYVHDKAGNDTRKVIVTGYSDGKQIQIISGVDEGDEVLTQGKP